MQKKSICFSSILLFIRCNTFSFQDLVVTHRKLPGFRFLKHASYNYQIIGLLLTWLTLTARSPVGYVTLSHPVVIFATPGQAAVIIFTFSPWGSPHFTYVNTPPPAKKTHLFRWRQEEMLSWVKNQQRSDRQAGSKKCVWRERQAIVRSLQTECWCMKKDMRWEAAVGNSILQHKTPKLWFRKQVLFWGDDYHLKDRVERKGFGLTSGSIQ